MSFNKVALITVIIITTVVIYLSAIKKSPRDAAIDRAVRRIFDIKRKHHDKIVKALEEGASESEHVAMLDQKRRDVIQAAEEAERNLNIVIDKEDPTEPGPVTVLER